MALTFSYYELQQLLACGIDVYTKSDILIYYIIDLNKHTSGIMNEN